MKVLITGSSGMIGGHLMRRLIDDGHSVLRLVRRPVRDPKTEVRWIPARDRIDREGVAEADAVIHLAGKNVASGRWNDRLKQEIMDSRVESTELLAQTLAELRAEGRDPKTLLSMSATGFYGSRGDEELVEDSPPGDGFIADVCIDWEHATRFAIHAGLRVVNMRLGVVLAKSGGMMDKLAPIFRLGIGGPIGNGRQWFPWIHIDDAINAIIYLLTSDSLSGPVNIVSPGIVQHSEFVKALGSALNRPAVVPVPAKLVELAMGKDMARDTVLTSQRVIPRKLLDDGFTFQYQDLTEALVSLLQ